MTARFDACVRGMALEEHGTSGDTLRRGARRVPGAGAGSRPRRAVVPSGSAHRIEEDARSAMRLALGRDRAASRAQRGLRRARARHREADPTPGESGRSRADEHAHALGGRPVPPSRRSRAGAPTLAECAPLHAARPGRLHHGRRRQVFDETGRPGAHAHPDAARPWQRGKRAGDLVRRPRFANRTVPRGPDPAASSRGPSGHRAGRRRVRTPLPRGRPPAGHGGRGGAPRAAHPLPVAGGPRCAGTPRWSRTRSTT